MEIEIIKAIQSIGSEFLDLFFKIVTYISDPMVTVMIIMFVYWVIDKNMGTFLGYSTLTSMNINAIAKVVFKVARPSASSGINVFNNVGAEGYSFPSGHSQCAATVFGSIAVWTKKAFMWVIAVVLTVLVAISRIYLGAHFPSDVAVGVVLGLVVAYVTCVLYRNTKRKLILFGATALLLLPLLIYTGFADGSLSFYCLFWGFIIGVAFEERFVKFGTNVGILKKILRFLVGGLLTFVINYAFKHFVPASQITDIIRYTFIGFFATGLYPYLFKRMKF